PVGPGLIVGLVLVVAAVLVGTWEPAAKGEHVASGRDLAVGVVFGVLAMVTMAASIVAAKPVLERSDAWWATTVRVSGGLVIPAFAALRASDRAGVRRVFRPGPLWRAALPGTVIGTYVCMIL